MPSIAEIREDPALVRRAVWLLGIIGGLQAADPVVTSLALPQAGKALNFDAPTLALAASISTLFLAATVVPLGSLADRVGRRKLLLILIVGVAIGDAIVVAAPATAVFLLGRAVTGICVGGCLAICFATVRTVSPPDKLGPNLGLWSGICGGLAVPLTIVASGLASMNWRLAFTLVPLIAVVCAILIPKILPVIEPPEVKRQLLGVCLAGVGVVGLLYGFSQTATKLISPMTVLPVVIGLLFVCAAAIVGLRTKRPAYPVRIFRNPVFVVASIAGILWNFATAIAVLGSSNLWQYVGNLDPFLASLLQVPFTIATVAGMVLIGKSLAKGHQPRLILLIGMSVCAGGFMIMSIRADGSTGFVFNIGMILVGLGAGMVCTAQSSLMLTAAEEKYLGPVAASRATFGQIGYAIGLAAVSVSVSSLTVASIMQESGVDDATGRVALNDFLNSDALASSTSGIGHLYTEGFGAAMVFFALISLLGGIFSFVLLGTKRALAEQADADARLAADVNAEDLAQQLDAAARTRS